MKIAILTTETTHHAYFAREIQHACGEVVAFCETGKAKPPPFEAGHPYEAERDAHEAARWFGGRRPSIANFVPTLDYLSLNEPAVLAALIDEEPDFVIVFGTGILRLPVCEAFRGRIFNLHGGDPQEYRGLDSHLWAIYHRDFAALVTCLHRLDLGLDSGEIVAMKPVAVRPGMSLSQLRAANSELCVALTLEAIDMARRGVLVSRPQLRTGRNYSAMPAVLKDLCVPRFQKHSASLRS